MELIPLFLLLAGGALSLAIFAFWLWMLIDCLTHEKDEGNQKLLWALVIIFTTWIGALIYFFVRKNQRKRDAFREHRKARRAHKERIKRIEKSKRMSNKSW
jgi:type VI protein secretion system component VasK